MFHSRHTVRHCTTSPALAQGDKVKPNTLTPKEVAEGWILLFDGETTFGGNNRGQIKDHERALDLTRSWLASANIGYVRDFELTFEYQLVVGPAQVWLIHSKNGKNETHVFPLQMTGAWTSFQLRYSNGKLRHLSEGGIYEVNWPFGNAIGIGRGLDAKNLLVRNAKVRPLNAKSVFNGKDLDGWRVFPGDKYKSKFTVKDGAINVKDGPGDLQTVGKYKDFILQFECISNGKHLNSGIFFRCRDKEYQNGYEAQIRNQFTKDATQKYVIEEYDAKTNKLVGKKEIMSTAFDYGTGAIYRRVPARKEMSKDNEWFGMTIVAHGNHVATWVNGVQVTDWSDNRPKTDNARTGCKLDAGHISIQGHDPTTDLSFKNFRIAELK